MIGKLGPAVLAIISFILLCIACGANNWIEASSGSKEESQGLWNNCVTTTSESTCSSISGTIPSWLKATRALSILSILISAVAVLGSLTALLLKSDKFKLMGNPYVVGGILMLAGGLMSGGARVYQNNTTLALANFDWGWTFYMAYGSSVFCFISTIILFVAYRYCRCCENSHESTICGFNRTANTMIGEKLLDVQ